MLVFSPDAAQRLASLPRQEALKLLARLVVWAGNPAGRYPWARRLVVKVEGRRVSHGRWHALCRHAGSATVVERLAEDDAPDDAADLAALLAVEVDELAAGPKPARAGYLDGDQVRQLLGEER